MLFKLLLSHVSHSCTLPKRTNHKHGIYNRPVNKNQIEDLIEIFEIVTIGDWSAHNQR